MYYMYGTISLPKDLLDEIEHIVTTIPLGYRNKTEFIVEAIRDKVIKIKSEISTDRVKS